MSAPRWIASTLTVVLLVLAGCGGGGGSPTAPPSGWTASDGRMWKEGVDTSTVFRNLESLSAMGILDEDFAVNSGGLDQEQFKNAIKRSLESLYRSNPTLVDTLFEQHAASQLEGADLSGNVIKDGQLVPKLLNKYKKKAFQAIQDQYKQPQLEESASIKSIPDSLRTEENSGRFELQLHVDSTGSVDAVKVVEGGHPAFNAILMRAATRTKWEPGYVLEEGEWKPRPGWGRMPLKVPPPRN